jgi:hypothetical protein
MIHLVLRYPRCPIGGMPRDLLARKIQPLNLQKRVALQCELLQSLNLLTTTDVIRPGL